MGGLSVVLETHEEPIYPGKPPHIISKATLLLHRRPKPQQLVSPPPATTTTAAASPSFLQRCSLCHKKLADGRDIYMYRGDRAFCSVECRCRQIVMDEDAGGGSCAEGARRCPRRTAGGAFAY